MEDIADKPIAAPDAFYGKVSTEEELNEPTETEDTETLKIAPTEDVEPENITDETDEVEGSEENEILVYDIKGEEFTADEISEWKLGYMRQSDYSRKTAEASEIAKAKASEIVDAEMGELRNVVAELQATIDSEDIDLADLKENDPEEYIKVNERNQKRDKLLAEAKTKLTDENAPSQAVLVEENKKLYEANPDWLKDGEPTEVFKSDMTVLDAYLNHNGWSKDEFASIYKAKHFLAVMKAAKYDDLQSKTFIAKKKVKAAPKVKKPKGAVKTAPTKSFADVFYSKEV